VRARLARHPRWVFHHTPTSGSPAGPAARPASQSHRPQGGRWLNAVETFFSALTRRRLKRGVFRSLVDLQAAIKRGPRPRAGLRPDPGLAEHNAAPKPFTWTATPAKIIAKLAHLNASVH
jgi:hypothetical protein